MKDNNIQNIADLIGALAEDIEEVKKKLDATDNPDKDEAVKKRRRRQWNLRENRSRRPGNGSLRLWMRLRF